MPRTTLAHVTPDWDVAPGPGADATLLWPFTQHRRLRWRSTDPARLDPVNLLVLHARPGEVFDALANRGWARPDDGAGHRTWVDGRFVAMDDHIALGERSERVHVRLFALDGATLAAAHHEVSDPRGRHIVTSWDRARAATVSALASAGYSQIAPSAVVAPPDLRGAKGDGRVWRLVQGGRAG